MKIVDGVWCDESGKPLTNMFGRKVRAENWKYGGMTLHTEPILTPIGWAEAVITEGGQCIAKAGASCMP